MDFSSYLRVGVGNSVETFFDTFADEEETQNDPSKENTAARHQSETPVSTAIDTFSAEEETPTPIDATKENTGARQSETSAGSTDIDTFSAEEETPIDASKENTGARQRQSEAPISADIVIFSDEEAQNELHVSRYSRAEDVIFEPMKDTFSLMFVCNIKSFGFAFSVFFFALQVAILVLIGVNILNNAPDGNPLNVPVGTSRDVVAAQVLALFVSLIMQSDFLATFDLINVMYTNTVLPLFKGATHTKWIISNTCRFAVGLLSIVISFILIIQSTTVIQLFFNFAAVQFVSELDNVAFELAYKGYVMFGDLEQTTRTLINHVQFRQRKMVVFPHTKKSIPVKWLRISIFAGHAVILYAAWSIVRYKQATGSYLHSICQSFEVNFGDEVSNLCTEESCFFYNETDPESVAELPYGPFSGMYEVSRNSRGTFEWQGNRPVYYQRNIEFGDDAGKFSYCKSEKAWVFTIKGVRKAFSDDCDWLLRSPKTEARSLGDAPTTGWSIWTDNAVVPADSQFELSCGECKSDVECRNGSCQNKICVCWFSWTGRNCQTSIDCPILRAEFFSSNGGVNKASHNDSRAFLHLEGISYKKRPVYYSYTTANEPIEIMFYSDGRFNVIEHEGFDIGVRDVSAKLRDYFDKVHSVFLESNINGYLDVDYTFTFVSQSTDHITPLSMDVTWRDDRPANNGNTLHVSCLPLCQSFEVQFNETIWKELRNEIFSGIYEVSLDSRGTFEWKGNRPIYHRRNNDGFHPGKFSYCESEKAWVFTIDGVTNEFSDECNWLLHSPKTNAYSLGDAPTTGWSIWNENNNASVPTDLLVQSLC
eukprot:scaffold213285_cov50-Attheya_sp.AAC.2